MRLDQRVLAAENDGQSLGLDGRELCDGQVGQVLHDARVQL